MEYLVIALVAAIIIMVRFFYKAQREYTRREGEESPRVYKKQLSRFVEAIDKMDINLLATSVAVGVWARALFLVQGELHTFDGSEHKPDLTASKSLHRVLLVAAMDCAKTNREAYTFGLMIWVWSIRALIHPELMGPVREMWKKLNRAQSQWNQKLNDVGQEQKEAGDSEEVVPKVMVLSRRIMEHLPPKQFR